MCLSEPTDKLFICACVFLCFSYAAVYRDFERTILAANTQEDLKWFSNNHGPGMHMNWPQFEVHRFQQTNKH